MPAAAQEQERRVIYRYYAGPYWQGSYCIISLEAPACGLSHWFIVCMLRRQGTLISVLYCILINTA
jgi:hypothetical protein